MRSAARSAKAGIGEENSRPQQGTGAQPRGKEKEGRCRQGEVCIKTSGARPNMVGLGEP